MPKTPIDEAPAGLAMDAAVAKALGYIEVPFETAKRNPLEIRELPATESIWVFTIDYGCKINSMPWIYRRHFGAGDFHLWSPSTDDITAAWELWELLSRQKPYSWALYSEGEDVTIEYYGDDYIGEREAGCGDWEREGKAPLVICRALLKVKGIEYIEVPE